MEETKKKTDEQLQAEIGSLSETDMDNVAGGKNYFESRSNTAQFSVTPTPVVPKTPPKAG